MLLFFGTSGRTWLPMAGMWCSPTLNWIPTSIWPSWRPAPRMPAPIAAWFIHPSPRSSLRWSSPIIPWTPLHRRAPPRRRARWPAVWWAGRSSDLPCCCWESVVISLSLGLVLRWQRSVPSSKHSPLFYSHRKMSILLIVNFCIFKDTKSTLFIK